MKLITLALLFITGSLAGNVIDWGNPTPPGEFAYKRWCPHPRIRNAGTNDDRDWVYEATCSPTVDSYIRDLTDYTIHLDNCVMNAHGVLKWRKGGGMSKYCEDCIIFEKEDSTGREEWLQCTCFAPGEGETTVGTRSRINLFEFMYYTLEKGLICDVR
ncbi:uncharacterized protein DNG_09947 [Cephalotrichum gorgonifer]|uniref:Cyanovirin-N domain-containing protein n=1 Tax=Cephalotrichum gorgonifer TaxID=2041049 RepID=A0AAE8N8E2_9PEZI|nr:uncharacterized protein DNG_09947 [Cephalotrichum gorgonifer]